MVGDGRRKNKMKELGIVVRVLSRQTDETESGRLSRRPENVGDPDG